MSVFRFPCSHDTILTQTTTFGYLNPPSKTSGIAVALFQKWGDELLFYVKIKSCPYFVSFPTVFKEVYAF